MQVTSYGPDTTTDEVLAGTDLTGKIAIVTGASGGIGQETARALAAHGAELVLAVRDQEKGERAAAAIKDSAPQATLAVEDLELANLDNVRRFTDRFLSNYDRLDILIANAAVMCPPFGHTVDGFELQFGTNHLGHFLMTCRLVPALIDAAPSRIVIVSSSGHRFSDIDFGDVNYDKRTYEKWPAYGQSKTANILFAVELDRRLRDRGVTASAVHPGAIMTDLSRHLRQEDWDNLGDVMPNADEIRWKSLEAGAATSVWAATAPELAGIGGQYLEDCRIGEPAGSATAWSGYAPYARDPESAHRLWTLSEQLVGEHFDF